MKHLTKFIIFIFYGVLFHSSATEEVDDLLRNEALSFKEIVSGDMKIEIYHKPDILDYINKSGNIEHYRKEKIELDVFPKSLKDTDQVDYFYTMEAGYSSKRFVATDSVADCIALLRSDGFIAHIHQKTDLSELDKFFPKDQTGKVYLFTNYYSPQLFNLTHYLEDNCSACLIEDIYVNHAVFTTVLFRENKATQCYYCNTIEIVSLIAEFTNDSLAELNGSRAEIDIKNDQFIGALAVVYDRDEEKPYVLAQHREMKHTAYSFIFQGVQRLEELNNLRKQDEDNFSHPAFSYGPSASVLYEVKK